jgi:hypothetical protein
VLRLDEGSLEPDWPRHAVRRTMRVRISYDGVGAGLHFHRVPKKVNGRSPNECRRRSIDGRRNEVVTLNLLNSPVAGGEGEYP